MERLLCFDIAKKLGRAPAGSEIILKSVKGGKDRTVLSISTGGKSGNDRVRAAAADYSMRTGVGAICTVRGKSVEVSVESTDAAPNAVLNSMELASAFNFSNEDAVTAVECFNVHCRDRLFGQEFSADSIDCDEGAFRFSVSVVCDDSHSDEDVYAVVMEVLNQYNMGIVKVNN